MLMADKNQIRLPRAIEFRYFSDKLLASWRRPVASFRLRRGNLLAFHQEKLAWGLPTRFYRCLFYRCLSAGWEASACRGRHRHNSAHVEEIPEGTPRVGRSLSVPFENADKKRVRAARAGINYVKTGSARQQAAAHQPPSRAGPVKRVTALVLLRHKRR